MQARPRPSALKHRRVIPIARFAAKHQHSFFRTRLYLRNLLHTACPFKSTCMKTPKDLNFQLGRRQHLYPRILRQGKCGFLPALGLCSHLCPRFGRLPAWTLALSKLYFVPNPRLRNPQLPPGKASCPPASRASGNNEAPNTSLGISGLKLRAGVSAFQWSFGKKRHGDCRLIVWLGVRGSLIKSTCLERFAISKPLCRHSSSDLKDYGFGVLSQLATNVGS